MNPAAPAAPRLQSLLAPIPGDRPAGESLRYEGTYDAVREARRSESPHLPQDIWQRERKTADWDRVEELCVEALSHRSKDLQIAAWLMESWIHLRGFEGAAAGMELLTGLVDGFWEDLFPELDEDGAELRVSPIVWINEKLAHELRLVPMVGHQGEEDATVSWADVERARWWERTRGAGTSGKRGAKGEEAPMGLDEIRSRVAAAPNRALRERQESIQQVIESTRALESRLDGLLGADSPSLVGFRELLQGMADWFEGVVDPTEDEEPEMEEQHQGAGPEGSAPSGEATSGADLPSEGGGDPIGTREEAYAMLSRAARRLERLEPHSPTPYLIKRAVEWKDMGLGDLLQEFADQGLDLKSLVTLLGLDVGDRPAGRNASPGRKSL